MCWGFIQGEVCLCLNHNIFATVHLTSRVFPQEEGGQQSTGSSPGHSHTSGWEMSDILISRFMYGGHIFLNKMRPLSLKMGQCILNHTTLHITMHLVNIYKYMINSIWKEERSAGKKNILSGWLIKVTGKKAGWLNWIILASYLSPWWLRGVKHLSAVWETWVPSLGWEAPLEKEMAIHSSTLAWKIPWTEEPGRLQSMGSQKVRHDWAT